MLRRQDEGAHDDVRVAIDVFREAVHDNIRALQERRGVERGEEGVVDEDKGRRGMRMGQVGDARYVN